MATTKIRTLNFLPEIFQTPTNAQFLGATLDQIVNPPLTNRIQGFIGSKIGYGVNANDYYVTEPTKTRTDYQLDPGVVFTKKNETVAQDFLSYPGLIDALKLSGSVTDNNSRLFESQFYSWDPFVDLDKVINYNQYYWLPTGAPAVTVQPATIRLEENFTVEDSASGYVFLSESVATTNVNPEIILLRGGTYNFSITQTGNFWIQGFPGLEGTNPALPNQSTRDILGVINNGTANGVITWTVPFSDAQAQYNLPGTNTVGVVSTIPYANLNGAQLSTIQAIDGVTSLNGLTVMFYTGSSNPIETANFYTINYTGNLADPTLTLIASTGIPTNQKITVQFGTEYVGLNFFKNDTGIIEQIPYLSAQLNTLYYQDSIDVSKVGIFKLIDDNAQNDINVELDILGKSKYTSPNGVVFTNGLKVQFSGNVFPVKYQSDTWYVQGVGTAIELIAASTLDTPEPFTTSSLTPWDITPWDIGNWDAALFIPTEPDYITIARNAINKNAWSRSNRWFHIDVIKASALYNNNSAILTTYATAEAKAKRPIIEFYPDLKLFDYGTIGKAAIDFIDYRTTDAFSDVAGQQVYWPDVEVYSSSSATIADAGATFTGAISGTTLTVTAISEGSIAVDGVLTGFGVTLGTIVTAQLSGTPGGTGTYSVDVSQSVLSTTMECNVVTTTITLPSSAITYVSKTNVRGETVPGTLEAGMYVSDDLQILPQNTVVTSVTTTSGITTITVQWPGEANFVGNSNVSIVANNIDNNSYALFTGARIVFANDTNPAIRNKIWITNLVSISPGSTPIISLSAAPDAECLDNDQTVVIRGYVAAGLGYYFKDEVWQESQQKRTVNQAPLFDVFDANGISYGDPDIYVGTSFRGSTLFSYGIGAGLDDSILGFPVRYSSINNVGDISFDVTFNSQTFDHVSNGKPINGYYINNGFVYNYVDRTTYERLIGYQTAVAPSVQYQAFEFNYVASSPPIIIPTGDSLLVNFACDVAVMNTEDSVWPVIQVYNNNEPLNKTQYTYTVSENSTTVTISFTKDLDTKIQILLLSDQVSKQGYYQIPLNLGNNPFNDTIKVTDLGDIRSQYQSIFYNNPSTTGNVFGPNNYRDLGNLVPWGNRIVQNSASLVLPSVFLRKQNHDLFKALMFNSREYIKFKTLLIDTVDKTNLVQRYSPAELLDDALDQITSVKNQEQSFFWSDMVPSKAPYASNSYSFANDLDTSVFSLSRTYDFTSANYYSVLVYVERTVNGLTFTTQLIRDQDYVVSAETPSLTVTYDLIAGDVVTINEYYQTYGSYVPNTPTKLGLYQVTTPGVVLDSAYSTPTYFIVGHDGSYNKLYGEYLPAVDVLVDFRDQVLLEFEKRVYNNLKVAAPIPVTEWEIMPGFFRNSDYTYAEWLEMYSVAFLDWTGQNRLEYKKQLYATNNPFTYNYTSTSNKVDNSVNTIGNWRGLYQYFYDTSTPNVTPWEMLGYRNEPSWWQEKYGPAPYTSDNLILWTDLAAGIDWNNGDPGINSQFIRPGLLSIIPVDFQGNLLNPLECLIKNYQPNLFQKNWKVGDVGPVELSYRRSSTWPFDLMRLIALTKPASFFNLAVDLDNYRYNEEFNQYLYNNRSHLVPDQIQIYGSGTPKTSYINWIVDYEKQLGVDATQNITNLLYNLDVRLVYRVAGYTDKKLLKFYVEKGTPNSTNASLLIPDESYSVLLYENQPYDRLIYSSVIVQLVPEGFAVYGNSQTNAYFTVLKPLLNGNSDRITVEQSTVRVAEDYSNETMIVPYGTIFYSVQELSQFIMSYGQYLISRGAIFDQIINGLEVNWRQMIAEFMYWAQSGWEIGSVITLNPAAKQLKIDKQSQIVQPLTIQQTNFVLNQNLYPIQMTDLAVLRDGTLFQVSTQNEGDTLAYGQFNLSNFEHGIVFDNITLFDDVIYNLNTGLRQNRIQVYGTKTAEWNGTVTAYGFILNQDNIGEWRKELKYTKGSIVLYKNKYWTALRVIQPSQKFNELDWKETDYDEIQKGLLPNSSTNSYESTLYYDVNKANIEKDADLLSFSLIGFRPRDYLAFADLTDITQINVYKNLIKNKGTKNSVDAFRGAQLPQGGIDYQVYENWAIKSGEFGGVLNNNWVQFKLNQPSLTANPSIVSLTNGVYTEGSEQEVPIYSLYNYARPITSPDILATVSASTPSTLLPDAGYVNFNDVKMSAFFYSQLSIAVNKDGIVVPLNNFYVRDYVWIANYLDKWQVFTPASIGQVISVRGNLNGTAVVTFGQDHNLSQYQLFSIINFDSLINGYYIVTNVLNPTQVVIELSFNNTTREVNGEGIALKFNSQRVDSPADISDLNLLSAEFIKNKVWVDTDVDGEWAVYRKGINYQYKQEFTEAGSQTFGSAVATDPVLGYLISDQAAGTAYRYTYNPLLETYQQVQTLTSGTSFGTAIAHNQDIYVVSESSGTPRVWIYFLMDSPLSDDLTLYQAAIARPVSATGNWGSAVAISGDTNWIYISATADNKVHVYRKQNIDLTAGYFVIGETYVITDVGTTDFTAIGSIENRVGIRFIATGIGSGTGQAQQITYKPSAIIDGSILTYADNFGKSISTDHYGDTVVIGAPNTDQSPAVLNWGKTYVYNRLWQNIEAQFNSVAGAAQTFQLAWTPLTLAKTVSATTAGTNFITLNNTTSISVNDPIIFQGNNLSNTNVVANKVYWIRSISGSDITIKESRSSTTAVTLLSKVGITSVNAAINVSPLYVYRNSTLISESEYAVIGSSLIYTGALTAGDIITVSGNEIALAQTLTTEQTPAIGVQFGTSVDTTKWGSQIIVGAPFALDSFNNEGAVYCYTNGGAKYGQVIGTTACNLTANRILLINGYQITLPAGNAQTVASVINAANITNIQAQDVNGNLIIAVINSDLAQTNEKLLISAPDATTLSELGFNIYTQVQIVSSPQQDGPSQFGTVVKFNESDSWIASAPVGDRVTATTFDFTDDENLDNDTIFDNNSTQFIDVFTNAGAAYMFDYLGVYNETLQNSGAWVYAQSVNDQDSVYGAEPRYASSIDFRDNKAVLGTPAFLPGTINGQVVIWENSVGVRDWSVYSKSAPVVNIDKIQTVQIFSAETNNTLINLDYQDPLQGKLLGAVRENIDVISNDDPASYNNGIPEQRGSVWGAEHLGRIWFDTTNVRYVNYHQNDVVYNSKYWGTLFPGSVAAVYTWVSSNVPPAQYEGPGVPYDNSLYTVQTIINANNVIAPVYYFWARNTNILSRKIGKTLVDSVLETYITNSQASGIAYWEPLLPNAFGLYNAQQYINANDSVLHIGYATTNDDGVSHSEYTLIRADFADDFLPGLPSVNGPVVPESLYDRMLDSLAGVDETGQVVPDPFLPKAVQSGVLARPRQSFFYNRYKALENYLTYANEVLRQFPIMELRQSNFLYAKNPVIYQDVAVTALEAGTEYTIEVSGNTDWSTVGASDNSVGTVFIATGAGTGTGVAKKVLFAVGQLYDTANYWERINWWATGYDNNTKAALQVRYYADLSTLTVAVGTIVTVLMNSTSASETYRYDGVGVWTRIGLQNGTIQFSSDLWDYAAARLGWGDNFYDTAPFDIYPSEETRAIVRALNEEIYTDELLLFRNKSLILLFEYIQSETIENQNYLPWLNKTSLVDVSHKIRELREFEVFQSDNQDFLSGYLNEVKPYHVVIKDFLFTYTGLDTFEGDITDFDLPARWNSEYQEFITPELVVSNPSTPSQYTADDSIWNDNIYSQWFDNRGLRLTGYNDYPMTVLRSYVTLASTFLLVDNAAGFPVQGILKIANDNGTYEEIAYSSVDRALNLISGLVRGTNGSTVSDHIPGETIFVDLPQVVLLNGGRDYTKPPKVTLTYDTLTYGDVLEPAVLEAVMSGDKVIGITVLSEGKGYPVQPEVVIDPAFETVFNSSGVLPARNTIRINQNDVQTGDLVQYVAGNGTTVGGLISGQWYYARLLEIIPAPVVALYTTYADALNDTDRVDIQSTGTGDHSFAIGAKATAIMSDNPTRELSVTMRFDRTTYTSQIQDWEAGRFYGAFFAGNYDNSQDISSSSIQLQSTQPDINTILASAQGVAFEISDITNDREDVFSAFERSVESIVSSDTIRLSINTIEPNASGSTIGFTIGMPVKFIGEVAATGLINEQTYYISEVVNDTDFKIALTENGSTLNSLTPSTIGIAGLKMFTAQVVNRGILTVNYPGIRTVTRTQSGLNYVTAPYTLIGTGGTSGFYVNMPLEFTGTAFGGISTNIIYYVTTVIDGQTFTMSENPDPVMITALSTDSGTDLITIESVSDLSVNTPVIFADAMIANVDVTNWGGVQTGVTYWIRTITDAIAPALPTISLSDAINGNLVNITSTIVAASDTQATIISQANTTTLTNGTGNMTMNVSLPVSPGQVNGQLFTLSTTSGWTANVSAVQISSLISGNVTATLAANDIILLEPAAELSDAYVDMPVRVDSAIGGLNASTTYYILDIDRVSVNVTQAVSNEFVCNSTENLYDGMPIVFSGTQIGGIIISQTYYVAGTPSGPTTFQITDTLGDPAIALTNGSGTMTGIGDSYIQVSTSPSGSVQTVTNDTGPVLIEQYITVQPVFDIGNVLGGYRAIISTAGSGFAVNNVITIAGNLIGGTTPQNDLVMTINTVSSTGGITDVICSGVVPNIQAQYWIRVKDANQFWVYSNQLLTIPVSGIELELIFSGFTTTTATAVAASGTIISDPVVTVSDSSEFAVNDAVVFTGTVFGNITAGQTYYILAIDTVNDELSISENPGDSAFNVGVSTGIMNMTKAGSYAFLPEPFTYNQSIVKYGNKVYVCVISNNDDEFILGKWRLLRSDDRRLNALDRIIGYYEPTINMPGKDLQQLVSNIVYPNTTYYGNQFDPAQQFTLDVDIQGEAFYPTQVSMVAIDKDASGYLIPANLPDYSALVRNDTGNDWMIGKFANIPLAFTDMIASANRYVMTSTNSATPIFRSENSEMWSVNGIYTTDIALPWTDNPITYTNLNSAGLIMQSVAKDSNIWVSVGNKIVVSDDTIIWRLAFNPTGSTAFMLYSVCAVNLPAFTGWVAVGGGTRLDPATGLIVPTNIIMYSSDGITWTQLPSLTTNAMYDVSCNGTEIVAVGENGIIYTSQNGADWFGITETQIISTNGATNALNVQNTSGLAVNDQIQFTNDFDVLQVGIDYWVESILSSTQIKVSNAPSPAPAIALLGTGTIPAQTLLFKAPRTLNLNAIDSGNSIWVAVGDGNANSATQSLILTSNNSTQWTAQISGVTGNLNAVFYDDTSSLWLAVGDQNSLIESSDDGNTWISNASFTINPPIYEIQGEPFLYGYGPEELVPGLIKDNLTMLVTTRPGTNWPAEQYAHVGYGTVSVELQPTSGTQTDYSFADAALIPAQIRVWVISGITGLATALYDGNDYIVDWVNSVVALNSPLAFLPVADSLRIDVYEVGNGDQIVKSNTLIDPLVENSFTGFDEIVLPCNYSKSRVQGGGVIRPGTFNVSTTATDSDTVDDTITLVSVANLTLNAAIQFRSTIGGLTADTNYYVKTISIANNKITVSASLTGLGIAGAVEAITVSETGVDVDTVISVGSGIVWTDPIVLHNGNKLILGKTGSVTRSRSSNNALTCVSTLGLAVGNPVVFSNTIFGGLTAQTVYYIESIVNSSQFTVSLTDGGPVVSLINATGRATYITNDYSIALASDNVSAKLMFAAQYDTIVDYLAYSLFTQTTPDQYGYTLPEIQTLIGDSSNTVFALSNWVGGVNDENAVVEYNSLRLLPSEYTIDSVNQDITFSFTPGTGNVVAITTFNDTQRQYLSTNIDANTTTTVANIVAINNAIIAPVGTPTVTQTYSSNNSVVCSSTAGFATDQTVLFKTMGVASFDANIQVDGTYYFVDTVVSITEFTIKDQFGTQIALAGGTGLMIAYVGESPSVSIITGVDHSLSTNDLVRIDDVSGATQLNNNTYYVHVVNDTEFFLYNAAYNPDLNAVNQPVLGISGYTGGGYVWLAGQYIIYTTIGESVDANAYIQTVSAASLMIDTPVYFAETGVPTGNVTSLGTTVGQEYYIYDVVNNGFRVSTTREGMPLSLSPVSPTVSVYVSQWSQTAVDRLWVTVNGYRVPSSSLRINPVNDLSILTTIEAGDDIIITSMMPSATPDTDTYMNIVNSVGEPVVYRINTDTTTYLTETVTDLSTVIYVEDVSKITKIVTQTVIAPAPVNGSYSIGLNADKNQITTVTVYNNSTAQFIAAENYELSITDTAPEVLITAGAWITAGDSLTIEVLVGNILYVNGEQIRFSTVDTINNTVSGLQRGVNGTGEQNFIPKYSKVYALLSIDILNPNQYNQTWNSAVYNTVEGDPLQISQTVAAEFLRTSIPA